MKQAVALVKRFAEGEPIKDKAHMIKTIASFFAVSKRAIDIDDVIDLHDIEFDPNITQAEWEVIREDSKTPLAQLQKAFEALVLKNKQVYPIPHTPDFRERIQSS